MPAPTVGSRLSGRVCCQWKSDCEVWESNICRGVAYLSTVVLPGRYKLAVRLFKPQNPQDCNVSFSIFRNSTQKNPASKQAPIPTTGSSPSPSLPTRGGKSNHSVCVHGKTAERCRCFAGSQRIVDPLFVLFPVENYPSFGPPLFVKSELLMGFNATRTFGLCLQVSDANIDGRGEMVNTGDE